MSGHKVNWLHIFKITLVRQCRMTKNSYGNALKIYKIYHGNKYIPLQSISSCAETSIGSHPGLLVYRK